MDKKNVFAELYPDSYFADGGDIKALHGYLEKHSFLDDEEQIASTEVPGDGNMNYVIRIKTNKRSFILKQARPWVEKYPSIEAPISRINVEQNYFAKISKNFFLKNHSPDILLSDPDNYILLLSDLGDVQNYSFIYQSDKYISKPDVDIISKYAQTLHSLAIEEFPDNMAMRKLNHEHIFIIPFLPDNGLDLDGIQKGLQEISTIVTGNFKARAAAQKYGDIYLSNANHLIHGDFYPGSWLSSDRLYVIDPEFCFLGPREFDIAVFVSHMIMAQQQDDVMKGFYEQYPMDGIDSDLVNKFISVEIIRRLVGVAQLPLSLSVEQKANLLENAIVMLI